MGKKTLNIYIALKICSALLGKNIKKKNNNKQKTNKQTKQQKNKQKKQNKAHVPDRDENSSVLCIWWSMNIVTK